MKTLLTLSALMFGSLASAQQAQQALRSVQLNGTGCPVDGYQDFHWEGSELVINFSDMNVSKGTGQQLSDARRNCAVILDLDLSRGWRYGLDALSVQGFADVAAHDRLSLTVLGYRQASRNDKNLSFEAYGPKESNFHFNFDVPPSETVWSSCTSDRALVLNTAVLVTNDKATGSRQSESYAALDQIRLRLAFARCP